jgi:hypothetical protein
LKTFPALGLISEALQATTLEADDSTTFGGIKNRITG